MCDVSSAWKPDQYVVNFRYGRRGKALREGTKTQLAVPFVEAEKIFDSLVVSKINKGYQHVAQQAAPQTNSPRQADGSVQADHSLRSDRYQYAVRRVKAGLTDLATGQLNAKKAGRLVWRAGELGDAELCSSLQRLLENTKSKHELLVYSIVWALGRCGNATTVDALLPLARTAQSDKVRRVATWAAINLAEGADSEALLAFVAGELPARLHAVLNTTDRIELNRTLDTYFSDKSQDGNDVLHRLYLYSLEKPHLRASLLERLAQLTPRPNVFRGMRQVYKAAEFFKDAEVFGILNVRFDVCRAFYTSPSYSDYCYIPGSSGVVRVSKEILKHDSRIAYSSNTRNYLRHRTWRSLRRLGELGLDDYIEMTMGVLLSTSSSHQQKRRQTVMYHWDGSKQTITFDEHAHFHALIQITFGASARYKLSSTRQAWYVNSDYTDNNQRTEKFLLQLLLESDLTLVQEFAAKAMLEQDDFYDSITADQLHRLITKPFLKTKELAFAIARSRYNPSQPDYKLVYLLLDSEYPPAIAQAREWVSDQPRTFAASADFLFWVVTATSQETRRWCRTFVELADNDAHHLLLGDVLNWLTDLDTAEINQAQVDDVEWVLLNPLKQHSASLPFEEILKLLAHPAPAVQVVAGRLLVNHDKPAEDVPPAVFARLLESPVAEVRGVGVQLFSQLPENAIVSQPELVESFCVADEAQVRAGIRPAIAKLANTHPDFNQALMRKLIDRLFRRETSDGVHDDLVSMLTTELADATATCDKALNWRLLSARSTAAQALGVWLLSYRQQNDFTVRQWSAMAHNNNVICRAWVWQCYRDQPEEVVRCARDALRITDGNWEDSRHFAFDYFRQQFPAEAWQPALLISICDSVRGDVQSFGRELLSRFFKEEDGAEYLLKLSQHPSSNVQMFASNYLERFASGNKERMAKLEPYFITVLSGVNKSRVSKNRVTQFLLSEASQSEEAASLVARIFSRQSVTMAITDKAKYLMGMRDLTLQYPNLTMPLTITDRQLYSSRAHNGPTRGPDTLRKPTHFIATLNRHIPFREAISALHQVVVSDLRFKPKDRESYFAWLAEQETSMLADFMAEAGDVAAQVDKVRAELDTLRRSSESIMRPYYKAENKYFNYLYQHDRDAWFVLDPVITVHPDQVFYECFSQDESTYGCLRCSHNTFDQIGDMACGTTNVDYSESLYNEFQKIREYKSTEFRIDPDGFDVQTDDDDRYVEQKIDLPDSWVRGFLQVSSAMTLPMRTFSLHPMDIHNLCFVLRRRKERVSPRSIRFKLSPGKKVVAVFEPWNQEVVCHGSVYAGDKEEEIRLWGRRRLLTLERLIPVAHSFTVHLLGSGMPSFFVAHMPDMTFTLGLSGWTANDWSRSGNFDLMAPRADVDDATQQRVYQALEKVWVASGSDLAKTLGLSTDLVQGALSLHTQAGNVIYDVVEGVYRLRELSREPLPMDTLRYHNVREENASRFVSAGLAEITRTHHETDHLGNEQSIVKGKVMDNAKRYDVELAIDSDERLGQASCNCDFYIRNKLYKGPCEHVLAVRKLHTHQKQASLHVA